MLFDAMDEELRFDMDWFRSKYGKQIDANAYLVSDVAFDVKEENDADRKQKRMSFFCTLARRTFSKLSIENACALYTALRVCRTREEAIDKLLYKRDDRGAHTP